LSNLVVLKYEIENDELFSLIGPKRKKSVTLRWSGSLEREKGFRAFKDSSLKLNAIEPVNYSFPTFVKIST
jgi:hypothetical protein